MELQFNEHRIKRCQSLIDRMWHKGSISPHFAAWTGDIEAVKKLKIRVFERDEDGLTPLHLAVWNMHDDVIQELVLSSDSSQLSESDSFGWNVLHFAAWNGDVRTTDLLISAGIDVSARSHLGFTAMHLAAHNGSAGVIRKLRTAGGDVHTRTKSGTTPRDWAIERRLLHVVDVLEDETV